VGGHRPRRRPDRASCPSRPWAALQRQRRRAARQLSRRTVDSRAHRHTKAKCAALDRRAANLRTNQLHTLTTTLTRRYGTIVVEDLDVQPMGRGMGRRAFRRTVYQAGIGKLRPTLAYKSGQQAGGWWWLTAGLGPPRPITAAAATWPIFGWTSGSGCVRDAGGW
jgi:hypothetical protein